MEGRKPEIVAGVPSVTDAEGRLIPRDGAKPIVAKVISSREEARPPVEIPDQPIYTEVDLMPKAERAEEAERA